MAKLTFTSIIFFFFFSFSHARTSPEIDVINNDLSNTLPQSNTTTTILLPSNNPELEPADPKPIDSNNPEEIPPESNAGATDEPSPVHESNSVSFSPINRHYRGKREFALGVPLRRCRHGDADIIISGEGGVVYPSMIHGERRSPVRLHYHQNDNGIQRFRLFKHQIFGKDKYQRIFHHEQERESKKEREERNRGGFVISIRKFLNPK